MDGIERCIDDEIPFEIPNNWAWTRLNNIIILTSGQDLTPEKYNSVMKGIPYITGASNIENEIVIINRWTEYPKSLAYKGDLLLTCKGTVGAMAFLQEEKVHIARQIMSISSTAYIDLSYIQILLKVYIPQLKSSAKSMIPGIARNDVLSLLAPIPSLVEQHHIVEQIEKILPTIKKL